MLLTHVLQGGHGHGEEHGQRNPPQRKRHRERSNQTWDDRPLRAGRVGVVMSHADFTWQKVKASTPSVAFSSLTLSSTVIRQPIVSVLP